MLQFLIGTLSFSLLLLRYLRWVKRRVDLQIEKMQEASFSTPGAESPVPPEVVVGGVVLLAGHFAVERWILRMKFGSTVFSMLLGGLLGAAYFISSGAFGQTSQNR